MSIQCISVRASVACWKQAINFQMTTYRFCTVQYSLKLMLCSYIPISNLPNPISFETYMLVMQESVLLAGRIGATHER